MEKVDLSLLPVAGDGNPQRMEIISFSPDIHDAPGACLRHIEGSSHTLFCMTPEEAYQIGQFLIRSAQKSLRDFKAKEGTK